MMEVLEAHGFGGRRRHGAPHAVEVMNEVLLPATPEFLRRYPHQLSGGQQQRVGLAMAFACRPSVIVLDEPTTGLDVTTQAHVLATVRDLCRTHGVAALYVTHDLAVVANLADRVAVMYAGRVVEQGPTARLSPRRRTRTPGTSSRPCPTWRASARSSGSRGRAPSPGQPARSAARSRTRCEAATDECRDRFPAVTWVAAESHRRCFHPRSAVESHRSRRGRIVPTRGPAPTPPSPCATSRRPTPGTPWSHDVDLHVGRGECLALVGESGSGKTTVSRSIGGLHHDWTGEILLDGQPLARSARRPRRSAQRLKIQYVFQNPYSSLNPRRPIGETVARPLMIAKASDAEARRRVGEMLERVSLPPAYADRYPDQLSGGERQRVAIARALVSQPDVLVCDEVTSALDVLVQAAIVELLADLQRDLGLSMLFVTHNLPLVRSVAHRVAVMADGRIVEVGDDRARADRARAGVHQAAARRHAADRGPRRRRGGGPVTPTPDFDVYPDEPEVDRAVNAERWVEVGWADGSSARFHHVWLRDNCACDECVHPITKEQTYELVSAPVENPARSATVTGEGELEVVWSFDGHRSRYHPGWLRAHRYDGAPTAADDERIAVGCVDARHSTDVRRAGRAHRRRHPSRVAHRSPRVRGQQVARGAALT